MGYFSNGSEGEYYQHTYCFHCVNWKKDKFGVGCAVWDIHQFHNGEEQFKEILNFFIPEKGITNGKCRMYREKVEDK